MLLPRLAVAMAVAALSLPSVVVAAAAVAQTPLAVPRSDYRPTSLSSTIDLGPSLARAAHAYALEPTTDDPAVWHVGIPGQEGFVEAWTASGAQGKGRTKIPVQRVGRVDTTTYYTLPLNSTSPLTVTLSSTTSHASTPRPASLPQTADAIALLFSYDLLAPLAFLSPHEREAVTEVRVRIKTPTPRVLGIWEPKEGGWEMNWSKGGTTISFANSNDVASFAGPQIASVQFQSPEPVATIRTLERTVDVSHWASTLAFQDSIDLYNAGPLLEGHFSRLEHQKATMQRRSPSVAVTSLSLALPPHAASPYYYDLVGNVSTSRFRPSPPAASFKPPASALLELRPRYPLMGGWNFSFTVGWDLPLAEYLRADPGSARKVLRVPFLTPIPGVPVDSATVRIRLPEAARNIKLHLPFPVDSLSFPTAPPSWFSLTPGYTKLYLDSTGRPTVVLTKQWCNDRHGGDVYVEYETNWLVDWGQKPLVVAAALGTVFAVGMALRRIEWSVGSGGK